MNENQIEVLYWWYSDRDYIKGVELFSRLSKNKVLARTLKNKAEQFGRDKLEYELPKTVGLHYKHMPTLSNTIQIYRTLLPVEPKTESTQKKSKFSLSGWVKSIFTKS